MWWALLGDHGHQMLIGAHLHSDVVSKLGLQVGVPEPGPPAAVSAGADLLQSDGNFDTTSGPFLARFSAPHASHARVLRSTSSLHLAPCTLLPPSSFLLPPSSFL